MQTSLTAPERETVVLGSDASEYVTIWTAQRPLISRLRKNEAAEILEEGFYGTTAYALFRLPAEFLSFRSKKVTRSLTAEQKAERAAALARAREARV